MQNRNKAFALCFTLLALSFFAACTANLQVQSVETMTPKARAAYAMRVYNAQYDDYLYRAALPNLSDEEKQVLRAKRIGLVEMWPVIRDYSWYVEQGTILPAGLEPKINGWLNAIRY